MEAQTNRIRNTDHRKNKLQFQHLRWLLRFWMFVIEWSFNSFVRFNCIAEDGCNAGMPGGMPDMGGATSAGGAGSGAGPTIEEVD